MRKKYLSVFGDYAESIYAYYLPGLYSGDPLVSFDTQPIEEQHGE
jgi:hypothetical protein